MLAQTQTSVLCACSGKNQCEFVRYGRKSAVLADSLPPLAMLECSEFAECVRASDRAGCWRAGWSVRSKNNVESELCVSVCNLYAFSACVLASVLKCMARLNKRIIRILMQLANILDMKSFFLI